MDVVELCKKYRNKGVVAIDLAGDESLNCEANPEHRSAYEVGVSSSNEWPSMFVHATGTRCDDNWN